jgi:hypothetical protein
MGNDKKATDKNLDPKFHEQHKASVNAAANKHPHGAVAGRAKAVLQQLITNSREMIAGIEADTLTLEDAKTSLNDLEANLDVAVETITQ